MSTYKKDLRPLILPSCHQQTHFSAQETPVPPSQTKTSTSECRLSLSPILSHSQTFENQKAVVSKKVHKTKRKKRYSKSSNRKIERQDRGVRSFFTRPSNRITKISLKLGGGAISLAAVFLFDYRTKREENYTGSCSSLRGSC
jgi:hypothetical protein